MARVCGGRRQVENCTLFCQCIEMKKLVNMVGGVVWGSYGTVEPLDRILQCMYVCIINSF